MAQLIFRFSLDVGIIPVTGTTNKDHMQRDLDIFDLKISKADINFIGTFTAYSPIDQIRFFYFSIKCLGKSGDPGKVFGGSFKNRADISKRFHEFLKRQCAHIRRQA